MIGECRLRPAVIAKCAELRRKHLHRVAWLNDPERRPEIQQDLRLERIAKHLPRVTIMRFERVRIRGEALVASIAASRPCIAASPQCVDFVIVPIFACIVPERDEAMHHCVGHLLGVQTVDLANTSDRRAHRSDETRRVEFNAAMLDDPAGVALPALQLDALYQGGTEPPLPLHVSGYRTVPKSTGRVVDRGWLDGAHIGSKSSTTPTRVQGGRQSGRGVERMPTNRRFAGRAGAFVMRGEDVDRFHLGAGDVDRDAVSSTRRSRRIVRLGR